MGKQPFSIAMFNYQRVQSLKQEIGHPMDDMDTVPVQWHSNLLRYIRVLMACCLAPFRRARAAAAVVKHLLGSYVTWESSSQIDLKAPNTRLIFNHPLK
jgi:hypothetical protein